jgi:hypothetical protein
MKIEGVADPSCSVSEGDERSVDSNEVKQSWRPRNSQISG